MTHSPCASAHPGRASCCWVSGSPRSKPLCQRTLWPGVCTPHTYRLPVQAWDDWSIILMAHAPTVLCLDAGNVALPADAPAPVVTPVVGNTNKFNIQIEGLNFNDQQLVSGQVRRLRQYSATPRPIAALPQSAHHHVILACLPQLYAAGTLAITPRCATNRSCSRRPGSRTAWAQSGTAAQPSATSHAMCTTRWWRPSGDTSRPTPTLCPCRVPT